MRSTLSLPYGRDRRKRRRLSGVFCSSVRIRTEETGSTKLRQAFDRALEWRQRRGLETMKLAMIMRG